MNRGTALVGGMGAPKRPKRTRLLFRFCICGIGLLTAALTVDVTGVYISKKNSAHFTSDGLPVRNENGNILWTKRDLYEEKNAGNKTLSGLSKSAITEFPDDIFTLEQRRHGAVILHVLCAIYMFHALAIVCDIYFVPSLEKISVNLNLSEDVAGATFMAAGSSAPELFTSLIGVFITKGDVGVGTIVGSAVFNVLVIIGLCGIFSGQPISLSWWPLFRDSVFYILSIIVLILVIYDEKVLWWETIILICMYGIYIIIMKFNRSLCNLVESHCSLGQPCLSSLRRTTAVGNIGDCDNDMVPLKPDTCVVASQDTGVVMVDELLNLHPHQLSFSEASLRLLITPHFPPFTRLRMAGRMVISERQRLIQARGGHEEGAAAGKEGGSGPWCRDNGTLTERDRQTLECDTIKEESGEAQGASEIKEEEEDEEEQEGGADQHSALNPFCFPNGLCERLKWLLSWPVTFLLYFTVPNCNKSRWERWYLLTFLSSTLWIALFSYLMVWMVTIISYTLGIPEVLMGITFLAAGTSVPDCMASLIVARQGMGDMAVSNSIGSNIFDVLLGLGFPWALRTLIVSYGSVVKINSKGLVYSVILLLASVTLTVLCVHLNHWKLDRKLGLCLMLLYAIFLLCSIGFERL
ncbi:sodium/potassium/calcium exchanger 3-like [Boleophthalmus pectinirostris]|uniref:sodium/potassium/calcium exchanger 3-like n=1 Tax=Boleophthalmus pectinirostris TaxID=150288 RepID=UPI002432F364|nr:sodium/potassium/calcium exchanger 3-like [Boleophthalmus pectinirostris]